MLDPLSYTYRIYHLVMAANHLHSCNLCNHPIKAHTQYVEVFYAASLDYIADLCLECIRDILANNEQLSNLYRKRRK